MRFQLSDTQWRTIFAAVALACAYLLVQNDVVVPPIVKLAAGLLNAILAAVNPARSDNGSANPSGS